LGFSVGKLSNGFAGLSEKRFSIGEFVSICSVRDVKEIFNLPKSSSVEQMVSSCDLEKEYTMMPLDSHSSQRSSSFKARGARFLRQNCLHLQKISMSDFIRSQKFLRALVSPSVFFDRWYYADIKAIFWI